MPTPQPQHHFAASLLHKDILLFTASTGFFTLAGRALIVVIGFQIYQLTRSPWSLGWLGLIEALPVISLVLVGGYVADHFNRRKILLLTRGALAACTLVLALLSLQGEATPLVGLYTVIFLGGVARGFADPAGTAFEAQVVPKHLTVNAASWISSAWIGCSIAGPAAIGFIYAGGGAVWSYICIFIFFLIAWISLFLIGPKPQPPLTRKEPMLKSISLGWRFVFENQPLVGAMALDLLAVLFGGAVALLPIFATDILHVGAQGLGLLNAAPAAGALAVMLYSTRHPPIHHAGRNLLVTVAGFGVSIIVFGLSKNFWLSMAALAASGIFDGVSMVIRRSMVRLLSPDEMRGRISAVSWIFICASNELGAFESGMVAGLIGTVPCVLAGGGVTLLVVAVTAFLAPKLRRLKFDPQNLEEKK